MTQKNVGVYGIVTEVREQGNNAFKVGWFEHKDGKPHIFLRKDLAERTTQEIAEVRPPQCWKRVRVVPFEPGAEPLAILERLEPS